MADHDYSADLVDVRQSLRDMRSAMDAGFERLHSRVNDGIAAQAGQGRCLATLSERVSGLRSDLQRVNHEVEDQGKRVAAIETDQAEERGRATAAGGVTGALAGVLVTIFSWLTGLGR